MVLRLWPLRAHNNPPKSRRRGPEVVAEADAIVFGGKIEMLSNLMLLLIRSQIDVSKLFASHPLLCFP